MLPAPVRQWLPALAHRVRLLRAHDPDSLADVRRILVRPVSGDYGARIANTLE